MNYLKAMVVTHHTEYKEFFKHFCFAKSYADSRRKTANRNFNETMAAACYDGMLSRAENANQYRQFNGMFKAECKKLAVALEKKRFCSSAIRR